MTKCDFCTKSDPEKGCVFIEWSVNQAGHCEEAIKRMENALRNIGVAKND